MTSLVKKMKNGKAYYYAVRCRRVDGKPRIVWQKYLGSVDAILKQAELNLKVPTETVLFEAGGIAALLHVAKRLGIIDLINEMVPKREQGPSVGHYILLAALNRALDPTSKAQMGDWYHNTVLQRLWDFPQKAFESQRFWDHMGAISEEAIDKIQPFLIERVRKEFGVQASQSLLYDTTNFYTYIDTHNTRNTVAQRGRNKQKRADLRQVNLALLVTRDFQIPLFHKTYEGNVPDIKFFPTIVQDLLTKHAPLFKGQAPTLVFDKGNLTEETRERLLYSGVHFIAGVKADFLPDLFATPVDQLEEALQIPGTKFREKIVEIDGKPCKAVVSHSESFFALSLASLTETMVKCQNKLKTLQESLLPKNSKKTGRRMTAAEARERLKEILSEQYMQDVFTTSIKETDGVVSLRYEMNRKQFDQLLSTRLGRTVLITSNTSLLATEVIASYRDLSHIESTFRDMKNRDYMRWQPAFHWTDQKIKVHTFYCVLSLLLVSLARKMAWEAGHEMSTSSLLDDLTGMKEVALLYHEKSGKAKTQFTMNRMSPRQKKLAELFEIGETLAEG